MSLPSPTARWAAHLRATWGLQVTAATTTAPLHLVATTPTGHVLAFQGAGTTLRLRLLRHDALRTVLLRPDCDCGDDHGDPARRLELDRDAVALWEHRVDGRSRHGWTSIEAATLDVAAASAYLDRLLADHRGALTAYGAGREERDAA